MVLILFALLSPFLTKTQMVFFVFAVVFLYLLYAIIKKKQSYWQNLRIDCVKPVFLLGNVDIFRKKPLSLQLQDIYNQFPQARYIGAYQGVKANLILKDPDLLKNIMVKEFDSFHDHRQFVDAEVDKFWGKNLIASTGERWRDLRTTLSPSFTSNKMKMMFSLMEECSNQFMDYLKANQDKELEMKDVLSRYTNDVIASTAFGLKVDSLRDRQNKFYFAGKKATDFGMRITLIFLTYTLVPFVAKMLKLRFIPKSIADYFTSIIEETIQTREAASVIRPDMIHLMMEARKGRVKPEQESKINEGFSSSTTEETTAKTPKVTFKMELTLEDIASQASVFFFAGFDTVSTFLSFAFYELAVNPEIQQRLREEVRETFNQSNGQLTYESLLGMKYLDMVVSESLRKWPASSMTDRKVTKPFTIQPEKPREKPVNLEIGTDCIIPIYAIHNDPRFYPNPFKFDPERFSEENRTKIVPFSYLPFGLGPRSCIGSRFALLEGKLLMANVLREFEVVPVERTHIPMVLDRKQVHVGADKGMWLGFKTAPL